MKKVKDKEWVKSIVRKELKVWQNIEGGIDEDGIKYILDTIDQLDEPEVLSQELPEIPKFVADHIEFCKSKNIRLNVALSKSPENEMVSEMGVSWEDANEIYARAWLGGYEVEKGQKYYAKIKGHELVNDSEDGYWNVDGNELYIDNIWHDYSGYKTTKLTKYDWNNLGINEDNADFVKADEVSE